MCVVSMVMDHYREKWYPLIPQQQVPMPNYPFHPGGMVPNIQPVIVQPRITDEEIAEFRRLLERAREYDKRNNEPNCELDEKKQAILAIAKQLGVEINFL